jgi:hypothetical protein
VASDEDLRALSSGDDIGFVGYPMESMALGGVNVNQPAPTVQVGHVTAVTDWFGGKDLSGRGQFVQHSLPATGGASGSPIVTADGKVVAVLSGGNIGMTPSGRIPLAVMVNFAQRADLVRELLDGTADSVQPSRTKEWEEGIRQFKSKKSLHGEHLKETIAQMVRQFEQRTDKTAALREEMEGALSAADETGRGTAKTRYGPLAPGSYLLIAAASAAETDIDLYLDTVLADGTLELYGKDEQADWYPVITFDLDAERTLEVTVSGPVPETPFLLRLYGAD